jgi:predicted nucleic acid-binding protein
VRARFLDSSVFLHAYLRPRRPLTAREEAVKAAAQEILRRVEEGEPVFTTTVHVSEVVNIVESRVGLQASLGLAARLLSLENVEVLPVSRDDYEKALEVAQRFSVSLNDAVAYAKMLEKGASEVYTFDKHFAQLLGMRTLPKLE